MKSYAVGILAVLGLLNLVALGAVVTVLMSIPTHGVVISGLAGLLLLTLFLIAIGIVFLWPRK